MGIRLKMPHFPVCPFHSRYRKVSPLRDALVEVMITSGWPTYGSWPDTSASIRTKLPGSDFGTARTGLEDAAPSLVDRSKHSLMTKARAGQKACRIVRLQPSWSLRCADPQRLRSPERDVRMKRELLALNEP